MTPRWLWDLTARLSRSLRLFATAKPGLPICHCTRVRELDDKCLRDFVDDLKSDVLFHQIGAGMDLRPEPIPSHTLRLHRGHDQNRAQ